MGYAEVFKDSFAGKTVVVSGGTSGIGLAIAMGFAQCSATVVATGSSRTRVDAAGRQSSAQLSFEQLDVTDIAKITARLAAFSRLDVLINCQGVARPDDEWTEETFLAVMDINLNGAMRMARAALPHLKQSKGSIVNVASMLSYLADPSVPAYTA
ncbi:MAG: SDR family NAD(P)-dependent oxidoreductase, partial [Cypionkella sp.]